MYNKTYRAHVMVCTGSICDLNRSFYVKEVLQKEIDNRG